MKRFFLVFVLLVLVFGAGSVLAQEGGARALGEVIGTPACFRLVNKAPYTVYGTVSTDYYIRPDGAKARHRSNFRLGLAEAAEFCTSGPFYPGRKLELVLRTLLPVFSCKTGIGGDILIYGREKKEGGTETTAVCL